MTAPICPVSHGEDPSFRNGHFSGGVTFPTAPLAIDLPSLISSVNVMRDVLRSFTGSRTVNNIQLPSTPNHKKEGNKYYSQYPEWQQVDKQTVTGLIFHKDKNFEEGIDRSQKAYVVRINSVSFKNRSQEDPDFTWKYVKKLDA